MSLTRLLCDGRHPHALVAFGEDARHTFAELEARVAQLVARLGEPAHPGERWLLHAADAFAFAVGLLGLWHARRTAVLPPNTEPGTLARAEVVGAVADRAILAAGRRVVHPLEPSARTEPHARVSLRPLDRNAPAVVLFTSGTTGAGRGVEKSLAHLADEVDALEALLGPACGDACVFATAPPHHLYGLLFRVLWPLASGRPFRAETYLHPEELAPRMRESGDCVLVGTPAHLRRLRDLPDLPKLRGVCRRVFSSGGPLEEDTARALADALGEAPVEIFGSTETGGVAVRQQAPGPLRLAWSPLPGVSVSADGEGRACVRSPFVSAGDGDAGFRMGDLVSLLPDGRFHLAGRADRVVKVGEKRLSLQDMEDALRGHPFVSDVALLPLGHGADVRVAAVVVPTAAGRDALQRDGRRAVSASLSARLEPHFDRVLLPRAHRYVEALPRDARGKTTVAALAELFAMDEDAPRTEPEQISIHRAPGRLEARLRVPADLAFVEGHFPGFPVVPGVVQLRWALALAGELLGRAPRVARIEALKFKDLLRTGRIFRAAIELDPRGGAFEFRISTDEDDAPRLYASGRCVLRDEGVT